MSTEITAAGNDYAVRKALSIGDIRVTDTAYGAIDDGCASYFAVTCTVNGTSLALQTYSGSITIQNSGPNGNAVLTFPGQTSNLSPGYGPQREWVGKPIAVAGAGASGAALVARVANFDYNPTSTSHEARLFLDRPAPTPLTASSQKVLCPCFSDGSFAGVPSNVGQKIWLSQGASAKNTVTGDGNFNDPYYPLRSTISSFTDPFTVVLADAIKCAAKTATWGMFVMWGTDNRAAVLAAGMAAIGLGMRELKFPGFTKAQSTGVFLAFDWQLTDTETPVTTDDRTAGMVQGSLIWTAENAQTRFVVAPTDINSGGSTVTNNGAPHDLLNLHQAVPHTARSAPAPRKGVLSKRFAASISQSTVVVCIVGESYSADDPSGNTGNAIWRSIVAELEAQNPEKTFIVCNRQQGGSTWRQLMDPANLATNANFAWITGGHPWSYYVQNCVTSIGTVTPDIIICCEEGGNDINGLNQFEVEGVVKMFEGWTTTRSGLAPDVIYIGGVWPRSQVSSNAGEYEYVALQQEYGFSLTRNTLRALGKQIIDYLPRSGHVTHGWSQDHLVLKQVPPPPGGTASTTVPLNLGYQCRDFLLALQLGSSQTGAAFWTALAGTLRIRLSEKPDHQLAVGVDGSGNLNAEVRAWGGVVATPVSITNGAAALTTSGQTAFTWTTQQSLSGPTYTILGSGADTAFSASMVGQCILGVGMYGYTYNGVHPDYRSTVIVRYNNTLAGLADPSNNGQSPSAGYWGGWMFVPQDAAAHTDVIIPGAGSVTHPFLGANCLISKITSYTDRTHVGLSDNASATLAAATEKMFLGRIVQLATFYHAINAGADASQNPVLILRKTGSRLAVGYLLGSQRTTDIRIDIGQYHDKYIWEGEIGGPQTPFVPMVWSDSSGGVTVTPLYMAVGERFPSKPELTTLEGWGIDNSAPGGSGVFDYPYGGDTSHPTTLLDEVLFRPVAAAQDFAIPKS